MIEIAFSETFYTDETPWGADRDRPPGRGASRTASSTAIGRPRRPTSAATAASGAQNFYIVAPPLFEHDRGRGRIRCKQPTRGGLMPVVLTEVGSITLRAEHDLLVSAEGQAAVAAGLFDGLAAFFGERELAGRIGLADAGHAPQPEAVEGDGPPFWPPVAPDGPVRAAPHEHRDGRVARGHGARRRLGGDRPAVPAPAPPSSCEPLGVEMPALAPGESVVVSVDAARRAGRTGRGMDLAERGCHDPRRSRARRRSSWPPKRPEPERDRTVPHDPFVRVRARASIQLTLLLR